jgi:DNA-binding response OmpR family regulator
VEDSHRLADTMAEALTKANYMVDIAHDGSEGYDQIMSGIYDLVILDLMLPKKNGYEVLESVRSEGNTVPVIILSAKSELGDKLAGFKVGADDYMTKPFAIEELLMRILAVTRRHEGQELTELKFGTLGLNYLTAEICNLETGKGMQIAGKELQMMELFLRNSGQVLEKEQIATKIWGYESDTEYNHVEVYVSFLRKKMKYLKVNVNIRAIRGVGYIMEVADDPNTA